ncbi:glycosyltransferase [Xylanimonas allomyrinae]|uniref:Glycosyltransferase n=1 Tax=Xylanimonas allomyrinae TaxID=2509459 RepID=A0A4P6EHK7_9MICO|nr:glycosyltransferase [Xylanimonas allomyrinae]QAY61962.1 glycosyltransferase [Xylanimonas allomyrinae]
MSGALGDEVLVVMAANHWTDARMADHQLAAAISEFGRVLYVDPPVVPRPGHGPRRFLEQHGNVHVLRPYRPPFLNSRANEGLGRRLLAAQVRWALRALTARSAVLLEGNVLLPVTGLVGDAPTVYWAQDDWQGLAAIAGLDPDRIARNEARLLEHARAVIAANPLIADQLESAGHDVELIPFGADTSLFGTVARQAVGAQPTTDAAPAVLMGTINTRIDFDIVDALAVAGVPLVMIGPITDPVVAPRVEALRQYPSVSWIGEVPFAELPRHLPSAAVGLVPYTQSRFNQGSFPLKTLEYLAAGLPVVATDLPAVRWLSCPDIHIAETVDDYVAAVVRRVRQGAPAASDRDRRAVFASAHDWTVRARKFRAVVDEVRATATARSRA